MTLLPRLLPGGLLVTLPGVLVTLLVLQHPELPSVMAPPSRFVRWSSLLTYSVLGAHLAGRRPLAWLWPAVFPVMAFEASWISQTFGPPLVATWLVGHANHERRTLRWAATAAFVFQLVVLHPFVVSDNPEDYARLHRELAEHLPVWSLATTEGARTFAMVGWVASLVVAVATPALWGFDHLVGTLRTERERRFGPTSEGHRRQAGRPAPPRSHPAPR